MGLGAALFALRWLLVTPPVTARPTIVIAAAQVAEMRAEFAQRTGRPPTAADEAALIDDAVDEEVLYRAAVDRGLDRNDRSVRYRLAEKMRFLSGDGQPNTDALYAEAVGLGLDRDDPIIRRMMTEKMRLLISAPPDAALTDSALRTYFERNWHRYRQPARVSLVHVFFSGDRRGDDALATALATRASLQAAGTAPEHAAERGDPFPLGHRFSAHSAAELGKIFGAEFAAAAMDLPPRVWSHPVASRYGLHLVWVSEKTPAQPPAFESVRGRMLESARMELRQAQLREGLRQLRAQYAVRVESGGNG